tara:strand:- start:212 stop:835 length:624 start_codon:yes stop_codon:yes gene_type:complete
MKKFFFSLVFLIGIPFLTPLLSNELGNADFPGELEEQGARSYHDPWCRELKRKCRVRFQGRKMWVEGFKGIDRSQLISFRFRRDGGHYGQDVHGEKYYYVKYLGENGKTFNALFLFADNTAAQEFGNALSRWYEQDSRPYPNFREPGSQGPQDTQGRDKGLNPYDNPPIDDWSIKSRSGLPKKCTNGTWNKKHPRCQVKPSSPMDMD